MFSLGLFLHLNTGFRVRPGLSIGFSLGLGPGLGEGWCMMGVTASGSNKEKEGKRKISCFST